MDPACLRCDLFWQLVSVRGLKFGQATILHYHFRQRIIQGQLLQHRFSGRGLPFWRFLDDGQAQFLEEDFLQLFRRAQVELLAGKAKGFLLEFRHAFFQLLALFVQLDLIQQNTLSLDFGEDRHQRQVYVTVYGHQ